MQQKTLAILSPSQNAYSETFIQAHKNLPFHIKFYYGGLVPTHLEGKGNLMQLSLHERIEKKLLKKFSLYEYGLYYSLKREGVQCVLAEYGTTACENLDIIKTLGLPLIVHFHGFDASVTSVLQGYAKKYKAVFAYAHTIIVVSKKMKEKLIESGCPSNKILLSICGPNPVFFENNPAYLNKQFVSVGRFVEKKAPHLTILAFKKVADKFNDAKLTMIGDGTLLPVCKDMVIGLGLADKVEFKGVLSREEIRKLFEESMAFVQHSVVAENGDSEGTPVAVLEAQAAALPVVATYHAGIPDVVIHNETGFLVSEGDVDGMAIQMMHILQENGLAKKMGLAGRARIKECFTLEKHLNGLSKSISESLQ